MTKNPKMTKPPEVSYTSNVETDKSHTGGITVTTKLMDQLQLAKDAAVPIVAISCPDPAEIIAAIKGEDFNKSFIQGMSEEGGDIDCPILRWDIVRGCVGMNALGAHVVSSWGDEARATVNPVEMLKMMIGSNPNAAAAPKNTILCMLHMHRFLQETPIAQAVWNTRDEFKGDSKMLILLAPFFNLPAELVGNVVLFDEPAPDEKRLDAKARELYMGQSDQVYKPTDPEYVKIVDSLIGLSAFESEQAISMSMSKGEVRFKTLKGHKISFINQTDGLHVYEGAEDGGSMVGVENVREFTLRQLKGMRCIVWVEELEKATGGSRTDSSGVAQDQMQQLLVNMQNNHATGILAVGPGGTGKSLLAKAMAGETGIPCIQLDLGAMMGSLVGESEGKIRRAMATINAVSQGKAFWIGTVNNVAILPPELRRRFNKGTFFFDLPTDQERESLWTYYKTKYGLLDDTSVIDDGGWTGAEIAACCENAHDMGESIEFAARYVVPIVKADEAGVAKLREEAEGRYISASFPGPYKMQGQSLQKSGLGRAARAIKTRS